MNPINILFSYVFAQSSAEKYKVSDTQKLQNTALISGLISPNPILSYLLIENEAKNLEVKTMATGTTTTSNPVETPQNTSLDKKIEEIVTSVITTKLSPNVLKSNDPKIESLASQLNSETFPYFIEDQIKSLQNEKKSFEEIAKNKFIDKLQTEDKIKFDKLNEVFVSKKLIDKAIDFLNAIKSSSDFGSTLPALLNLRFESTLYDLKSKLREIELGIYKPEAATSNDVATVTPEKPTPAAKTVSVKK